MLAGAESDRSSCVSNCIHWRTTDFAERRPGLCHELPVNEEPRAIAGHQGKAVSAISRNIDEAAVANGKAGESAGIYRSQGWCDSAGGWSFRGKRGQFRPGARVNVVFQARQRLILGCRSLPSSYNGDILLRPVLMPLLILRLQQHTKSARSCPALPLASVPSNSVPIASA